MYISVEESNRDGDRNSPAGTAEQELERLRTELDEVDAVLLDTVRARLDVCIRIGQLKQSADIAVTQPARMEEVHRRARDFADRHGLSAEFFDFLYDVLIAETCRLEEQIIDASSAE